MSNKQGEGLYTDRDSFNPQVNAIPLSDADARAKGEGSIGDLVKDASAQISSLVRSEIELAKTEVATSAKKAGIGGGLFAAAAVILAYSSFFLFFTIAEALDTFLPRWLAFLIVFLFMLVLVGILALVGLKQVVELVHGHTLVPRPRSDQSVARRWNGVITSTHAGDRLGAGGTRSVASSGRRGQVDR